VINTRFLDIVSNSGQQMQFVIAQFWKQICKKKKNLAIHCELQKKIL